MVVSCQLGQVGWRSTLGTSTFGLLCLFNGHKLPENAIKQAFLDIGGSDGRGGTEDIISYFTLMSSEIHYYDIIEKMGSWTLMSSEV